nr:reverse transcriptase domain-containing protein [Tanacetum cinerariifolium]
MADRTMEELLQAPTEGDNSSKTDDRIDKLADQISNLVEIGISNQPFQVPNNQIQPGIPNKLSSHMKSNETLIRNIQNQINVLRGDFNKQEENLRRNLNNDMRSILGSFFQIQASTSGTLPINIMPNLKGEMKVVTTRSGLASEGPSIPTNSPLEKVVERDTEETTDKEHSNCQGSTAHVQPLVVPISILEPDVLRTQPKPTIPYPSILNDQKLHEKAMNQMEKFFQIFHDLHFDISFVDALLLMPKFSSTIKSLLTNKDKLFELAKVLLNENRSAMLLKKLPENLGDPGKFLIPCDFLRIDVCHALADLGASINLMPLSIWKKLSLQELTPTRMTLELVDRSITRPKGVAEDVFVKVGKFHFPTDFVVLDFEADPRVPLILGRSFLRTGHVLIDVYGEEITLRVNAESVTFNLNQTMRYSSMCDDNSVNRVDVIDNASGINNSFYDPEGDILYLEKFLNEDPLQLPPMDLKQAEKTKEKSSIEEPPELEMKELPSHLEYAFLEDTEKLPVIIAKDLKDVEKEALIKVLKSRKRAIAWKISDIKGIDPRFYTHKILMEEDYKPEVQSQRRVNPNIHDIIKKEVIKLLDAGMIYPISDSPWEKCHFMCKEGIVLGHKILMSEIEVDRAKVDVIAKLHHPTTIKGVRSFLGHASFYRRFIQDFSKIARPMTHLLEKETPFVFSKECVDAFDTLQKNLTEAPILVVPDWNLPFELMCDASDFAIGAILGQCKTKHFQPIHSASKTMTEAQIHYTMTEKEMVAVVYAFEKFRSYLVLSKSIVSTDHSALKYLFNKQDAKMRLLRWVLLLQEFDITIRDKKESENLTADHLSRLENPHKDVLENKDINENFPLETLGSLSSGSTPWSADIANFHTGNFIKKGLTSQQKKKFFKDVKHYFWDDPYLFQICDRGTYFCNDQFARVMIMYGVTHRLATAYHPQTSGQVEVSNRGLKRILERTVEGKPCLVAYENYFIYKEQIKKLHDSKIKNHIFNVGDQVLLFNSHLKIFSRKLKTHWSGPFTITQVFPYGTVELSQPNGPNFKVNGHHVKHYFRGDIPSKVVPDLHAIYPTMIEDFRVVMSSPNHPTSDIKDAFSSTYSPDYFPALPGNTSLDPSDDLSKYLLASLAISPFHDDPYMKFMHAYDAIIPPQ